MQDNSELELTFKSLVVSQILVFGHQISVVVLDGCVFLLNYFEDVAVPALHFVKVVDVTLQCVVFFNNFCTLF